MPFKLKSDFKPAGDQPQAIKALTDNLKKGINKQVLLGVTGSGKTFTIANIIQNTQLPTLIISHNKTLAAQLYQEFKELFPKNKVSYFVSYYDYYQPESYLPASDTYIAKEVDINQLIDKLRLEATSNLFSGSDNIIIASVSCIYNIGSPEDFKNRTINFSLGKSYPRRQLFEDLVNLYYTRNQLEFVRSTFRVRGELVEIWPSYEDWILSLEFSDDKLVNIIHRHPFSGQEVKLSAFCLFPAKQYVGAANANLPAIFKKIRADAKHQADLFKSQNRILEAQRIHQRTEYDLEMLQELGYVNGIENYSIYFDANRTTGDPPYTLVDYFRQLWGDNFLTVIDESHVTVPQIGGMHRGDQSRKQNLIDFGFRLPSALDNRPLTFSEFYNRVPKAIYVSATPNDWEIKDSQNTVIEQLIRPTGLIDPPITLHSSKDQIPHLISQIKDQIKAKNRTLVITITKRMAEDLATYLADPVKTEANFKVAYLHSDIDTLERSKILDDLRSGTYDVLVGINLLREGLDLPEVSLVVILDADSQGFLRSKSSLIQIMGRASRSLAGQVILYADTISDAMRQAILVVNRRRRLQQDYNQKHGITPQSIIKAIRPQLIQATVKDPVVEDKLKIDPNSLTPPQLKKHLTDLRHQMRLLATDMNFEEAIKIRDHINSLTKPETF
jgi:excinuclease ABC subunit B